MEKTLKVGDIVSHKYRKSGVYLVVETQADGHGVASIVRVKKQSGYPIAGTRSSYRVYPADVTKVAHASNHARKTKEQIMDEKLEARTANNDRHNVRVKAEIERNMSQIGPTIKARFLDLCGQLSPENLCCDGEASTSYVRQKKSQIMRDWHSLEKLVGCRVTEGEAWKWCNEPEVKKEEEKLCKAQGLPYFSLPA